MFSVSMSVDFCEKYEYSNQFLLNFKFEKVDNLTTATCPANCIGLRNQWGKQSLTLISIAPLGRLSRGAVPWSINSSGKYPWWRNQLEPLSALLTLCAGNPPVTVEVRSPHKGQWRGALMSSLICDWVNSWVNNREPGDVRRHGAHYNVIVMSFNWSVQSSFFWGLADMMTCRLFSAIPLPETIMAYS